MEITLIESGEKILNYPTFVTHGRTYVLVYIAYKSSNIVGIDSNGNEYGWSNEHLLLNDAHIKLLPAGTKLEIEI